MDGIERRRDELERLGVGRGARVAVVLGNGADFFATVIAVMGVGAVPVPMSSRAPAAETDALIEQSGANLVIGAVGARTLAEPVRPLHDDAALVLFTSGTTARPKGAVLSHGALIGMAKGMAEHRFGLREEDALWAPLPVNHVGPITLFLACLHGGARFLTMRRLDGQAALDQIERERATILVPNFIAVTRKLVEQPDFDRRDLSSVRAVNSVGSESERRFVRDAFPGAVHTTTFGMTETCGAVTRTPLDSAGDAAGRALPGVRIRIVEPGTTHDLPSGARGEILVGGFPAMLGYLDEPDATAEALTADGFFRTTDEGFVDGDGRLHYLGRLRSTIKVGGENVAPAEVVEALMQHPAVVEAHVVGAPDERLGEVVAAFVEVSSPITTDDLVAYCRERVSPFRVPRVVQFMETWPMSETKVDLGELRRLAREARLR